MDYILFKNIPRELKKNKRVKVILLELSGIQKYIFEDITIATSVQEITRKSSHVIEITESILAWLIERYKNSDILVLNKSSGKIFVSLSPKVSDEAINMDLKEMQRIIYASTGGRLELFYSYCVAKITNKAKCLQKGNAVLRLSLGINENKYRCINVINIDIQKYKRKEFELNKKNISVEEKIMEKKRYMAIKLDLDNLGVFFNNLMEFDEKKQASHALNEALEESVKGIRGIIPIFVGGDDIFFIAPMKTYLSNLYKVYVQLKKAIESKEELKLYQSCFGLSAGCNYIRNDLGETPLYFYYNSSEKELEKAKKYAGKNVVSAVDTILTWEELGVIESVLREKYKTIIDMLDSNQEMVHMVRIKMLRDRIITLNRNQRIKLTAEQERILSGICKE